MIIPNPEQLTRELINEWASNNPIIRACLMLHLKSGLSYEQVLIAMVHCLASQNKELIDEKAEGFFKQPMVIQVSQAEYDHYKSILDEADKRQNALGPGYV